MAHDPGKTGQFQLSRRGNTENLPNAGVEFIAKLLLKIVGAGTYPDLDVRRKCDFSNLVRHAPNDRSEGLEQGR